MRYPKIDHSSKNISAFIDESAFLWSQRWHVEQSSIEGFEALSKLDTRLEATIEGTLLSPDVSRVKCLEFLDADVPGAVSLSVCLAVEKSDAALWERVVNVASSSPTKERELSSALSWLPYKHIEPFLIDGWKSSVHSSINNIILQALIAHRRLPSIIDWSNCFRSPEEIAILAMHVIGVQRRPDLLPIIENINQDEAHLGWFSWVSLLLGNDSNTSMLLNAISAGSILTDIAFPIACQTTHKEILWEWIDKISSDKDTLDIALIASGILGTTSDINRLLSLATDTSTNKQKKRWAHAFYRITGYYPIKQKSSQDIDLEGSLDDEELTKLSQIDELAPSDLNLAISWWKNNRENFSNNKRYRCGALLNKYTLLDQLKFASQSERCIAAYELGVIFQAPVVPITAPTWRQRGFFRESYG